MVMIVIDEICDYPLAIILQIIQYRLYYIERGCCPPAFSPRVWRFTVNREPGGPRIRDQPLADDGRPRFHPQLY